MINRIHHFYSFYFSVQKKNRVHFGSVSSGLNLREGVNREKYSNKEGNSPKNHLVKVANLPLGKGQKKNYISNYYLYLH